MSRAVVWVAYAEADGEVYIYGVTRTKEGAQDLCLEQHRLLEDDDTLELVWEQQPSWPGFPPTNVWYADPDPDNGDGTAYTVCRSEVSET